MSTGRPESVEDLAANLADIRLSSGYASAGPASVSGGSGSGSAPPIRKADEAYNHLELAVRPGLCKAARAKINIVANYFRLGAPTHIKCMSYRITFKMMGGKPRAGDDGSVKKEKMTELFCKCFKEHRHVFPARTTSLIFNGTDCIFVPPDFRFKEPTELPFIVERGARNRPDTRCLMTITVLPMISVPTVCVDEEKDRCALMQIMDLIISQEHRYDLTGKARRFVQHGHSFYKIPSMDEKERYRDVKPIGKGEEVWLGLHSAVKTEGHELMLNADTSGSIFKARNMNLVDFYAQVIRGYTLSLEKVNFEHLMIEPKFVTELGRILKGARLRMVQMNKEDRIKKFDGITCREACNEYFDCNGKWISVAEYYLAEYNYRLRCPNLPCLSFYNKATNQTNKMPLELFWTLDEPQRFKGKLTDQQLDVFIKAVCQNPKEKKARIQRLCAEGGDYLGNTETMREWGISIDRNMVTIDSCPVLPLPHIEMKASKPATAVDLETGQWKITETAANGDEVAIPPVEVGEHQIVFAVTYIMEPNSYRKDEANDMKCLRLMQTTLKKFGVQVNDNPGIWYQQLYEVREKNRVLTNNLWIDNNIQEVKAHCEKLSAELKVPCIPLQFYVFPRRQAQTYAAIKYYCDVKHGVPSQCITRKVFEKLTGNAVTNASAQNVLMKILAKTGSLLFRLSSFQHKNIEKLQNPEDPVLILGVDVSHPGKEERFEAISKQEKKMGQTAAEANRRRGQHEKLPTARPAGAGLFRDINFYDCPRSVVSVVGSTDIQGSRFGVSSRVQRLGQEETLNMVEPFRERIREFIDRVGSLPKHVLLYRDGASDTQVKKIAYEELNALESALESFDIAKESCTITYVTAVKRHHTRLFRANLDQMPDHADAKLNHYNCPPGTLVDQTIVSRNKWDFFLQSHYGNLGTASPTRYTVVRDDWNVSSSFVQTIIFAHCFGNVRCPKPLSIPIPLHYAHLAAKRAKVCFDFYKENASNEYYSSKEDLVREECERTAVTAHPSLIEIKAMPYV